MYREEAERSNIFRTVNESYTNGSRLTYVYEGLVGIVLRLDDTGLAVERECFVRLVVSVSLHETIFVVEAVLREAAHSVSSRLIHHDSLRNTTIKSHAVGADLRSDGQGATLVVDVPTARRNILREAGIFLLIDIIDKQAGEAIRVDSIVSRSDDTRIITGSLVLEGGGGNHLIDIDILRYALDVEDELQETVFNRSLLHLDDSSAVRTAVNAIDGKVSEVSSSRVDLRTCGVEVVNSLSVTAGEHGSATYLRGSLLINHNTALNRVHIPLVVAELVAFDGFDTTVVAIGDEFETNEEVVFEEVQAIIDIGNLVSERFHLVFDESINLFLRGTFSEFFFYFSKTNSHLIESSLKTSDSSLVLTDSSLVVSSSRLVVSNTLFERADLIQGVDLRLAEEVLRLNSLKAFFKFLNGSLLRIDTSAKRLISRNEFAHLRIERTLERCYATLNSLNIVGDITNLFGEFRLVNLAVDERLQLSFRLFETLHFRLERCDVGESVLKIFNLSLNRFVGSIEILLLSVVSEFAFDLTNLLISCIEILLLSIVSEFAFDLTNLLISCIEILLLSVVSELSFDLTSLLVGCFELSLQGGDLAIQVVLDRYEISLVGSDLFANGSKIIIVVLAGHERASRGCHNEQTEQCAINDFLVHEVIN